MKLEEATPPAAVTLRRSLSVQPLIMSFWVAPRFATQSVHNGDAQERLFTYPEQTSVLHPSDV